MTETNSSGNAKAKALKNLESRSGRGITTSRAIRIGIEKRSLNHATRYSLHVSRVLFVNASLVARQNAERSDKSIQADAMHNTTVNHHFFDIFLFSGILFSGI